MRCDAVCIVELYKRQKKKVVRVFVMKFPTFKDLVAFNSVRVGDKDLQSFKETKN